MSILDPTTREALEFDALLEQAAALAETAPGARRTRAIEPASNTTTAQGLQAQTTEARRWIEQLSPRLSGLDDPEPVLAALRVAGLSLEPAQILVACCYIGRAAEIKGAMKARSTDFPVLWKLAEKIADLGDWKRSVTKALDGEGNVLDSATPEIRRVRSAIRQKREELNRTLERYFSRPEVIQDSYVTERNGRYVIPVRAERKQEVEGVLHGASSSGATVFLEPLPVVGMNNELALLLEQEALEVSRIIQELTSSLRRQLVHFDTLVEAITQLDVTAARARLGLRQQAVEPALGGPGIEILQARHPLLMHFIGAGNVVPVDVRLNAQTKVLVISGPNTGGKTAALKTVGLLALMSHCGFQVPAREARFPMFSGIRADVGDHQSLQQSLSTFSSHILRLKEILAETAGETLVLLDELGAGTDPSQGASLALAVLETLVAKGAHVIVTTHLERLKAFAQDRGFAENAAVEFDEQSLRPTFRLISGISGHSNALTIAQRIGLDREIVDLARSKIGNRELEMENYLQRLNEDAQKLAAAREELQRKSQELDRERIRQRIEAEEKLARRQQELEERLAQLQRQFEESLKLELAGISDKVERQRRLAAEKRKAEALRESFRRQALGYIAVADQRASSERDDGRASGTPEPRARVLVISLDQPGVFLGMEGKQAVVEIAGKKVRLAPADLRCLEEPPAAALRLPSNVSFTPAAGEEVPHELNLIGKTVDEALPEVDKFLDKAALESYASVRLIHGRGSGRLAKALREFLQGHLHVASARAGNEREGGNGVTVVELR
jgi:DNA mismatch repair protein MutS2